MICTPYVAGPVHSLLSNCTVVFVALLSICVLGKRHPAPSPMREKHHQCHYQLKSAS